MPIPVLSLSEWTQVSRTTNGREVPYSKYGHDKRNRLHVSFWASSGGESRWPTSIGYTNLKISMETKKCVNTNAGQQVPIVNIYGLTIQHRPYLIDRVGRCLQVNDSVAIGAHWNEVGLWVD
jgi:hypothetical protein